MSVMMVAVGASVALVSPPNDLIHSGTPPDVPGSFDCAIRAAAYEYGMSLLPSRGAFQTLYDAVQLGACPSHKGLRPTETDAWSAPNSPLPTGQPVLFVDAHALTSDETTYMTLHSAVQASRELRRLRALASGAPITIAVRGGQHYLATTLELGAMDSGLTIRGYPGEKAVVSAGVPLGPLHWTRSAECHGGSAGCWSAQLGARMSEMRGLRLDGARQIRARYPNFDPERDTVINGRYLVHDGYQGVTSHDLPISMASMTFHNHR